MAGEVDAFYIIGGRHSSNSVKLLAVCKEQCEKSFLIETAEEINPGDLVVMDGDGAMVLPAARTDEVLPLALEREQRENEMRERYRAGELSYDLQGLRTVVEG